MRRLIAYITSALALLLAIGVAATPAVTKLNSNAGREFTSGKNYREIVFNVSEGDDESKNDERSSIVAEQMRKRLNSYNVEDYSVKIQDENSVAVALDMDSKKYNYCAKYLAFSGESFALAGSNGTIFDGEKLFDADDIRIDYKKIGSDEVPCVVIPLTEKGIENVKALCKELTPEEEGGSEGQKAIIRKPALEVSADGEEDDHDHEGEGEGEQNTDFIYLWANYDESRGENIESLEKDPVARDKILMAFNPQNIWYEDSKEEETEIFYACAKADAENENQLDISGLEDENARANYLVGLLKASKYDFEVTCPSVNITKESVDYFINARVLTASAESLSSYGNNVNIKMSKTFIAVAIAVLIISLLLVVYYRLSALAIISTSLATGFITLVSVASINLLFNIPAIIGFIILTSGVLFGEIAYVNRFKEEVYKGRTIKKANQEASKKTNLLVIDSAIVMAFSGLMMYAIGGVALKPLGIILFFGAVFTLAMNMLVFKLLMYLVTNSTNLQQKYNVFNIDGEKVPNIMAAEEKPAYEAPYEKVNFTKKKGLISILFGVLSAAALACIVVFGVTSSSKSPLNVEKAISDTTVVYTSFKTESVVTDEEGYVKYILKDTGYEEQQNIIDDIEFKKVTQYNAEDDQTLEFYYVTLNVNEKLSTDDRDTLLTKLESNMTETFGELSSSDPYKELTKVEVKNSQELIYTPSQGYVALATGVAIAGVALYFAFRFRPSRGISVLVTTLGATAIAYGAMVAMRFAGTTALTSVAMPLVAITMMLASLFYLTTEKTMLKEGKFELTREVRQEIMVKSIGKSASSLFAFMLINIYIIINFFGFGVENSALLFASAMIGEVIAVIALLCITGPLAIGIEKLFSKIHLPKIKWFNKDKPKQQSKRNSSEPEETIFIGIND